MNQKTDQNNRSHQWHRPSALVGTLLGVLIGSVNIFSETLPFFNHSADTTPCEQQPDTIFLSSPVAPHAAVEVDSIAVAPADGAVSITPVDTVDIIEPISLGIPGLDEAAPAEAARVFTFNPDPTRAVWLSALCPGLGQLYNRRYWKLPIVVGAFMGLGYATSWNNTMLQDYTRAYSDILDNDPNTKSYMDFFPTTTREEDLDRTWLTNVLQSRKNFYRRNRDLCIICMVGVYLLAMVDAYVDASLSHFDISPDLSVDLTPAVFHDTRSKLPSVGLQWAFNF